MNHIFRLVWKFSASQLIPVCEFGRRFRRGRRRGRDAARSLGAAGTPALLFVGLGLCAQLQAGPTGGQITTGSGQVTQSGTTTTIRQNSQTLGLNWASFNVAANESVNFVQPGSGAIAVNRILSSNGSEILGHLNANGQVWLINPNGILFGSDAQVNVGGLVASTLAPLTPGSAGETSFGGGGTGSIVNQGALTAAKGGYVALLGNHVSNQGIISAQLGTVALAAGSAATLTFAGNKLLQIQVDNSTLGNLADNRGLIAADGGAVYLTAGAMNSVLASSVNTSGVIRASTFENHEGTIVLGAGLPAGEVTVGGTLDVSAIRGAGGDVTATAGQVTVGAGAKIDASGSSGGGAIRIGGGWEGGEAIAQATTVSVADGATLDASATSRGNGGEIVVRSDVTNMNSTARVNGTLLAQGGPRGGDGGRIETSGHWLDVTGATVDTAAPAGAAGLWLLDPYNITIGATGTNVSTNGGTYTPTADSTITASSIATALQNGNNVTISTFNAGGGSIGDITVASAITKASGNTNVTLTLQAADTIVINAPISNTGGSGTLNVNLYADNNNGAHDGVGVVILNNSISTGGGNINFGTGVSQSVNGVTTLVGGDVYVGGGSTVNLTTAGGNVAINGALIIANINGLNIDTTNGTNAAGNVLFDSTIDSGDTYALIQSFGAVTWTAALADAKSGVGSATGDTYLATITSRLENAVASYDVNYVQSWLGGARVFNIGTDAEWRWVTGPEGLTNNGQGLPFFTQTGCLTNNCAPNNPTTENAFNGGTAINGAYTNWNPATPEPNNYGGTSLNQAGSGEWTLQFVGTQGQWNDLNPGTHVLPFAQETNVAPSPLTVNAGTAGTVTFTGAIGGNKPLATLTATGQILGLPTNPQINTTGPVTFNGQVQINGVNFDVLVVTAPSVTTTYGATLPTLTPTYSGFVSGDTVASLTTLATATTTGSTAYVSTAPIIASGAADATNPNRYYFLYDPGVLTVNPAPLTVTGTTVTTRAYNGLTNATLTGGSLSGVFSADAANVTLTQAGTFTSKNAAVGIPVTVADSISGSAAANYTLTQPTVTGTITPLALTVTGSAVTPKVYDGTPTAALTGGVLNGVLNADLGLVSLTSQSGSFASKNVGTGIAVTAADSITATGAAAGDYTVTQPTGLTGTITAKPITVNGSVALNKTYDGTTAVAGGVTGYTSPTGLIGGDSVSVTGAPVYSAADVGARTLLRGNVAFTGTSAGNYALNWVNGSGTISPAPLTVTANADSRFVGLTDTVGYAGVSYQGLVNGQTSSVLGGTLSISRTNAGVGAAGTYNGVLVPAGLTATDYAISFQPGNYTIVPADTLLINATNISTVYGTAPGFAISSVQYLHGNNVLLTLTQTGVSGSTYQYADGLGGTATFTLGAAGSVASSSGNLAVGTYTITDATFSAQGANFTGVPVVVGNLAVTPLGIQVSTTTPATKTYDATTSLSGAAIALSGVLPGDAVTGSAMGTFASKNVGTGIGYTLTGLTLTGADARDYYLTNTLPLVGSNGSITPSNALLGTGAANVLATIVNTSLPGGGAPYGTPGAFGNGNSFGNGNGNGNGGYGDAVGTGATGSGLTSANASNGNTGNGLANGFGGTEGGVGTNGSLAGTGPGLSLGANAATAADDGTVTLSAGGAGGAGGAGSGTDAGIGASASAGSGTAAAGDGTDADSGANAAGATRRESLASLGGRRLIVISGGVNSSAAH